MKKIMALIAFMMVFLVACTTGGQTTAPVTSSSTPPPPPPAAEVVFSGPAENSILDYRDSASFNISVAEGTLDNMVSFPVNKPDLIVTGDASEDKTSWTSNTTLLPGNQYQWEATARNADGKVSSASGFFYTSDAAEEDTLRARTNLGDGYTVGIATPIIITFSGHVEEGNRAEVESRLAVTSSLPSEGSWAWLPDDGGNSRIHYRTKDYWTPYNNIHVDLPLKNVPYGNNIYGRDNITLDFTIGRSQVVTADAQTHRMSVVRDGVEVENYPASLGAPGQESLNGIHVVTERLEDKVMTSERFGYSTPVKWAVRLHNNGEFIHAAPWSVGSQGRTNVSHGCVNLSTENAKEYFESAMYGDPVIIQGASESITSSGGDIWDWTVSYDQWKEMSALS